MRKQRRPRKQDKTIIPAAVIDVQIHKAAVRGTGGDTTRETRGPAKMLVKIQETDQVQDQNIRHEHLKTVRGG